MTVRLALAQLDLCVGDLADNCRAYRAACAESARQGADLVLAPSSRISGYPPEDLVLRRSFLADVRREAEALAGAIDGAAAGGRARARRRPRLQQRAPPARRRDRRPLRQARAAELRRLRRGAHVRARPRPARLRPRRRALRRHDLRGRLARGRPRRRRPRGGATVLLNISSSPYHLGKGLSREEMLRTRARDGLCFVAYCNLVGGQDELVFDGRQRRHRPRRRGHRARRLVRRGAADLRHRPAGRGRRAAARLAAAARAQAPPPRAGAADRHRRARARRSSRRIAAPPADARGRALGRARAGVARLRAQERLPARRDGALGRHRLRARGGAGGRGARAAAVEAVSMPTRFNAAETRSDAQQVAEAPRHRLPRARHRGAARRSARRCPSAGGLAPRTCRRASAAWSLMTLSNQHGWLVLTTGNKSETAVGYSTLYGDTAGGFAPIKDVPKTTVFALAAASTSVPGARSIPRRSSTGRRAPSCATTSGTTSRCRPTTCSTRSSRRTSRTTARRPRSPRPASPLELAERVARLVDRPSTSGGRRRRA